MRKRAPDSPWPRAGLALVCAALLSCSGGGRRPETHIAAAAATSLPEPGEGAPGGAKSRADNIMLVTLDGVRWQEIFRGVDPALAAKAGLPRSAVVPGAALTPNLHRLFFEGGVVLGSPDHGGSIAPTGPVFISLPAYMEMMSGASTPCLDNECAFTPRWTVTEALGAHMKSAPEEVAVFASWEAIARTARSEEGSVLVRAGRAPDDAQPPYPGAGAYRPDRSTAGLAMEHLVAHRPRFLWISLGDTDEWAHRGDYRGYLDALRAADGYVGELAAHLDELGDYGARTTVIVTTDHGRGPAFQDHGSPASAAIWLMARGASIEARGEVATDEPRYLRDLAPTLLALVGAPAHSCMACGKVMTELR